ncbi:DUF4489 domain-containing protein [Oscillospiraceae bacterium LTW-04]|nr:DUF4489 domain-containing protein [Oscillospiraceae bacterium MB24-C1]
MERYNAECYNAYSFPKNKNKDKDCCDKARKVLLECGFNPEPAIFAIDDDYVEPQQCFDLDRLVIDTTDLCRPIVKIEFSSLICFEAESNDNGDDEIEVKLLFELERICNGKKECVQNWYYVKEFETENELEVEISEPFTVTFCDRTCPGCCEYKMVVKGIDFDGKFEFLNVVKPNLSAIAQGLCSDR